MRNLFFKGRFVFIPLAIIAFLSVASFAVMELWNNLIPDIFHLGAITFGQAMGLFVLCKILFGFGKGGRGWGGRGGAPWMRQRMEERFKSMTPEQKEKFKQKMRDRSCGPWGHDGGHRFGDWDKFTEEPAAKPAE
jgi:hypothetical protein